MRLVEEFEVMEGLEERVKRLKEKREALRMKAAGGKVGSVEDESREKTLPPPVPTPAPDDEGHDESDEDEDDWGYV
jgi:hypothetical protein